MEKLIKDFIVKVKKYNKYILMFIILAILFIGGILVSAKNNHREKEILYNEYNNIIVVKISGDVMYPGKYEIEYGTTIGQLLKIAGFDYKDNEPLLVNKNAVLENNEVINIKKISSNNNRLNINTASIEELSLLLSNDLEKASNIYNYRMKNGSFKTVNELLDVTGINSKILNSIINEIRLS